MKALHGSGGGTKGIGIYGSMKTLILDRGYKPDLISGISISALLALPIALGKWKELDELMMNFTSDTFFNVKPLNSKGKFTFNAILRFIFGKSFGEQYDIITILKEIISEKEFNEYKKDKTLPICIIMSVDLYTGKRIFINLKNVSYKEWLIYSLASASIPLYVPEVKLNSYALCDGGLRNHIISGYCNKLYNVTDSISIYARPKEFQLNSMTEKKLGNIDKLQRTLEILTLEISKSDQFEEEEVAKEKKIKNHQIFLPKILENTYDSNRERLNLLYKAGIDEAKKLDF